MTWPSHGIQQEDEEFPQRDELKVSLGELIVPGRVLMAAQKNHIGQEAVASV